MLNLKYWNLNGSNLGLISFLFFQSLARKFQVFQFPELQIQFYIQVSVFQTWFDFKKLKVSILNFTKPGPASFCWVLLFVHQ